MEVLTLISISTNRIMLAVLFAGLLPVTAECGLVAEMRGAPRRQADSHCGTGARASVGASKPASNGEC